MAMIKDKLEDFDDSGYDTLKEENKYKKIVDFHAKNIEIMQESISSMLTPEDIRTLTEDKRREEADNRDRDIANGWYPEE